MIRASFGQRSFKHARILIVDDEPGNVEVITRVLQSAGFHKLDIPTIRVRRRLSTSTLVPIWYCSTFTCRT